MIRPAAITGMLHEHTERESMAAQPIQTADNPAAAITVPVTFRMFLMVFSSFLL
jgi:hypothetical protein